MRMSMELARRRARLEAQIERLIDRLDALDAGAEDLEPEPDEEDDAEFSAQPLTLCPDWKAPEPFQPLGEVIERVVLGLHRKVRP
ncbi:hypothetical protein [Roseomonas sp. BN140053]|uniref:hypothetical protein n=1 Tax=Roseomonas sp. BN140053 TaxID=3391898 RepID=UPI0039E7AF30